MPATTASQSRIPIAAAYAIIRPGRLHNNLQFSAGGPKSFLQIAQKYIYIPLSLVCCRYYGLCSTSCNEEDGTLLVSNPWNL